MIPLVGCGILKQEIEYLIQKNKWPLKSHFLCSSLHIDFEKLEKSLVRALSHFGPSPKGVFYGTCHPRMDSFMEKGKAVRTAGQNCVEILLGKEVFERHLSSGAFFIMEDWSRRWGLITGLAFGRNPEIIKEIFTMEHTRLLGIKTPCSKDFTAEAEDISRQLGLPLGWLNISLEHLEKKLSQMLSDIRKM
ncbi:DUF1638 domain-containing protein [Desulfospira joergensenii]|uniref:DUF1638 domain-containing protein n=1 Tax=Desulfospira joergensenii TaxID=53329 RepID=UPI0004035239|nr:DUF1638 domain-containing protein [Desulfospira joergensenii]